MSRLAWRAEDELEIDGVTYACRPIRDPFPSSAERFCLRKPRAEVERYERFLAELEPETVVELGIYEGGSTALIAQLAAPRRLVALDIRKRPVPALSRFIAERGLEASVRPHWGVDQADRRRLRRIVADELGDDPLDLVIDDASHLLAETRASFETLFPRLRPGGVFVIEDWSWAHAPFGAWPNKPALTKLVFELVVAAAHSPQAVAGLQIDRAWTSVRRGPAELDADRFELAALCGERGRALLAGEDAASEQLRGGPLARLRRRG